MRYRMALTVLSGEDVYRDKPVELILDFGMLYERLGEPRPEGEPALALLDDRGNAAPFQFDRQRERSAENGHAGTLVFICEGRTGPGESRAYELYFDNAGGQNHMAADSDLVKIADDVLHEGQASILIETPAATWFYHKAGAGFASLHDPGGTDWLGYRPCCESAGEYRGIPNMWKFHPGQDSCRSRVEIDGPLRARVRSTSLDSRWECVWDIFPSYARMTLLRAGGTYWFLYEGIPGGSLEVEHDYNLVSSGLRRPISESWHDDLPAPEWVCFGDDRLERVLFVAGHEDDSHSDQFWQMRGEMVVFGFGREFRCCDTYMSRVPARFTVGFVEDSTFAVARETIAGATGAPDVRLAAPERRE